MARRPRRRARRGAQHRPPQVFLGADPAILAAVYLPEHEERLRKFEALREVSLDLDPPRGGMLALEAGIGFQRESVRFWKNLLDAPPD